MGRSSDSPVTATSSGPAGAVRNAAPYEGDALVSFDRRVLRDLDDIAAHDELLALAWPDGDLELFVTERNEAPGLTGDRPSGQPCDFLTGRR